MRDPQKNVSKASVQFFSFTFLSLFIIVRCIRESGEASIEQGRHLGMGNSTRGKHVRQSDLTYLGIGRLR